VTNSFTKPSRLVHAAWIGVLLLFFLLCAMMSFFKIDVVVIAEGKLKYAIPTKNINAPRNGKILKIYVFEGSSVKQGDPLVELDSNDIRAEILKEQYEIDEAQAYIAAYAEVMRGFNKANRISLESSSNSKRNFAVVFDSVYSETNTHLVKRQVVSQRIRENEAQIAVEEVAQSKYLALLSVARDALNTNSQLIEKGFLSRTANNSAKQDFITAEAEIKLIQKRTFVRNEQITQLKIELKLLNKEFEQKIFERLAELNNKIEIGGLNIRKANLELDRSIIRALGDGTVEHFSENLKKSHLELGEQLMLLIPDKKSLVAELIIKNKDAPYILQDQKVYIELLAFSVSANGSIEGIVKTISQEAIAEGVAANNYLVIAEIQGAATNSDSQSVPLKSGMNIRGNILISKKRPIELMMDLIMIPTNESLPNR
jgi:hemolysin D